MKNTTFLTIGNENTYLTLQVNNNKSKGKAFKELSTKFLAWYDTMRFVGASTFKANKPLEVKFTINNRIVFDSKDPRVAHGACKLKIQNTPKGRVRFEERMFRLLTLIATLDDVDTEKTLKGRNEALDCIRMELGMVASN